MTSLSRFICAYSSPLCRHFELVLFQVLVIHKLCYAPVIIAVQPYELGNMSGSTCLEDIITRICARLVRVSIYPANMIRL